MKTMEMLRGVLLVGLVGMTVACTLFADKYGPLAEHLHSPEGLAEWKQNEQVLRHAADAAIARYRQEESMEALRVCETSVREYLDHGFLLLRAYRAAGFDLPPRVEDSLSARTDHFMDVADGYLKQGSEIVAVSIA
jgi:hypothetical protein